MSNTQQFLNEIKAGCLSLWKLYGILPSVAAAQAALESGWGSSSLAAKYNNLFGIKGAGVSLPTTEYYDGKTPIGIVDSFRVYPNWNTSILDYGVFLNNYGNKPNRYDGAIGLRDSTAQITAIWKAGYATDPQYVSKIVATINANGLNSWDKEVLDGNAAEVPPSSGWVRKPESATFYPNTTINIRNQPSRSGIVVGQYNNGEFVVYDSYVVNDGHVWISYISFGGERRYMAIRTHNGTAGPLWGSIR